MAKGKNKGKRLNKKQLVEMLSTFFKQNPNETYSYKQIFKKLNIEQHPVKMLAIDILEDMTWDDFLAKEGDGKYRLNLQGQAEIKLPTAYQNETATITLAAESGRQTPRIHEVRLCK